MTLTPAQQALEDAAELKITQAEAAFALAQQGVNDAWVAWNTTHGAVTVAKKELRELLRSFR